MRKKAEWFWFFVSASLVIWGSIYTGIMLRMGWGGGEVLVYEHNNVIWGIEIAWFVGMALAGIAVIGWRRRVNRREGRRNG